MKAKRQIALILLINAGACATTLKERWDDSYPADRRRGGRIGYDLKDANRGWEKAVEEGRSWCGEGRDPFFTPTSSHGNSEGIGRSEQHYLLACPDPRPHLEVYKFPFGDTPTCPPLENPHQLGTERYEWIRKNFTQQSCDTQGWLMLRDMRYLFVGSAGLETCNKLAAEAVGMSSSDENLARWIDKRLRPCDGPALHSTETDVGVTFTLPRGFSVRDHRNDAESFFSLSGPSILTIASISNGWTSARTPEGRENQLLHKMAVFANQFAQTDKTSVDSVRPMFWDDRRELGALEMNATVQSAFGQKREEAAAKWTVRRVFVNTKNGTSFATLETRGEADQYLDAIWSELIRGIRIRGDVEIVNDDSPEASGARDPKVALELTHLSRQSERISHPDDKSRSRFSE